jgi:hypothetical protein
MRKNTKPSVRIAGGISTLFSHILSYLILTISYTTPCILLRFKYVHGKKTILGFEEIKYPNFYKHDMKCMNFDNGLLNLIECG